MQIATCVRAVAGGLPFHTVSTSVSTDTMRPGLSSSSARMVRCRAPPMAILWFSLVTSKEPRI